MADVANVKLRLKDFEGARKDLDASERVLDSFDSVETVVHAAFYKVNAEYYHVSPASSHIHIRIYICINGFLISLSYVRYFRPN